MTGIILAAMWVAMLFGAGFHAAVTQVKDSHRAPYQQSVTDGQITQK